MAMDVNVNINITEGGERVWSLMQELKSMITQVLSELRAEVVRDTDATAAVVNLLNTFIEEVEANKGSEAALTEILDGFRLNTSTLAAAVAKNTPAAPAVAPAQDPADAPIIAPPTDTAAPV